MTDCVAFDMEHQGVEDFAFLGLYDLAVER